MRRYQEYLDFYEGRHFLRPRNGRTNLVVNYARTVVDKGVAYLLGRGLGFSVPPKPGSTARDRRRAERAEQLLYDVYWDNSLDAVDLQVAQNAGALGDGVYKVFWDPLEQRIRVVSVDPSGFFATWQADDPSRILRVEVAYAVAADAAESFAASAGLGDGVGSKGPHGILPAPLPGDTRALEVVETWTASELVLTVGEQVVRHGPNPYGWIPFVHVPNLQPANAFWGISDLVDVIPINRELDERISDQADIIRYHADPPIVFRGVTDHSDLAVGPGTVWDIPTDADVKLLEWQGQPPAVGEHIERTLRSLYEVSETPRTAFGETDQVLSGVALETQLRPIIQKTLRRHAFWTRALRDRNRMILRLAEQFGVEGAKPGDYAPYRSRVIWPPMVPRDDTQDVRNQVSLVQAGLRSHRTAMDALGTESPEEELARVLEDRARVGDSAEPAGDSAPNTDDTGEGA
ncbi:MAG: phage portal protein [Thermoleophilia bacterium]|nr:phage portal protein [Thermoleophilia bacterium]